LAGSQQADQLERIRTQHRLWQCCGLSDHESIAQPVKERVSTTTAADEVENRIGQFAHQPTVLIRVSAQGVIPGATASDGIAGVVHGGKSHLFLDQLNRRRDVQTTLFHELFHYRLQQPLTHDQFQAQVLRPSEHDTRCCAEMRHWTEYEVQPGGQNCGDA